MPAFKTLATNVYCKVNFWNVESEMPPPPPKCRHWRVPHFASLVPPHSAPVLSSDDNGQRRTLACRMPTDQWFHGTNHDCRVSALRF